MPISEMVTWPRHLPSLWHYCCWAGIACLWLLEVRQHAGPGRFGITFSDRNWISTRSFMVAAGS